MGSLLVWASRTARPKLVSSGKQYKFGDSRAPPSLGPAMLIGNAPICNAPSRRTHCAIRFVTEVVNSNTPLLPRPSMRLMNVSFDFSVNRLNFPDLPFTPLHVRPVGHLAFHFKPSDLRNNVQTKEFELSSPSVESDDVDSAQSLTKAADGELSRKLRFRRWHSDVSAIKRLCDLAVFLSGETQAMAWMHTWKCGRGDRRHQFPIAGHHIGTEPGETLMMAITYPMGGRRPKGPRPHSALPNDALCSLSFR